VTVAVVGAGISGAAAVRRLADAGQAVAVFDKGRGPGGRMARRRVSVGEHTFAFDHGAQWTRARDPAFAGFLDGAVAEGRAAPWPAAPAADGVVGVPGMNALVRHALGDIAPRFGFTLAGLERGATGWRIFAHEGEEAGPFRAVVLTMPAPQLEPLIAPHAPAFAAAADAARYAPCWALMLAFAGMDAARLSAIGHDALSGEGIEWVAHDGGKPGREGATLLAHADGEWSRDALERAPGDVAAELEGIVCGALNLPAPVVRLAHRWRFSRVTAVALLDTMFDRATMLGVAGDWTTGASVEAAYLSGLRCADAALPVLAE